VKQQPLLCSRAAAREKVAISSNCKLSSLLCLTDIVSKRFSRDIINAEGKWVAEDPVEQGNPPETMSVE
jgi:hypothetical protein